MSNILGAKWRRKVLCRSFAGEALERERFGADVVASYHSGVGFAKAKANVESLNRHALCLLTCTSHLN